MIYIDCTIILEIQERQHGVNMIHLYYPSAGKKTDDKRMMFVHRSLDITLATLQIIYFAQGQKQKRRNKELLTLPVSGSANPLALVGSRLLPACLAASTGKPILTQHFRLIQENPPSVVRVIWKTMAFRCCFLLAQSYLYCTSPLLFSLRET